jgi:small subunit ribosomal protein S9
MAEETKTEKAVEVANTVTEEVAKRRASPKRKAAAKKEVQLIFVKSKRKNAVARGSAKSGNGMIRVNSFNINTCEPIELRRIMLEPIRVSDATHEAARRLDIDISVYGGGQSSQAQAVRGVIAKCIEKSSGSDLIKKEYLSYDRFMLIDDSRRVEPKKFKGPKARARFQKSYR